jgi:hypothetical protein
VLAAAMPLLEAEQFARVFGPSAYILINALDHGGLKRIPRPEVLPPATHGPLRLTPAQMEGIATATVYASRLRNISYLRRVAPENSKHLLNADLLQHVDRSIGTGSELGLKSEKAHWKWSYLMLLTNGQIGTTESVRTVFNNSPYSADRTLDIIMRDTISHLKNGSA